MREVIPENILKKIQKKTCNFYKRFKKLLKIYKKY